MQHFFITPDNIHGDVIQVQGQLAHQLSRVLRVSPGSEVNALDNRGFSYHCRVASVSPKLVVLAIENKKPCARSPLEVTLYQAIPKGDKLEWIIQKATELGVHRVQPLLTRRCVSKWELERGRAKLLRWRSIAQEAAEQCERPDLPVIEAPVSLETSLKHRPSTSLVLAERDAALNLRGALPVDFPRSGLGIYVGPEGGWSPEERDAMKLSGCTDVSLGTRILRTETASLAALAIVQSNYDWPA